MTVPWVVVTPPTTSAESGSGLTANVVAVLGASNPSSGLEIVVVYVIVSPGSASVLPLTSFVRAAVIGAVRSASVVSESMTTSGAVMFEPWVSVIAPTFVKSAPAPTDGVNALNGMTKCVR